MMFFAVDCRKVVLFIFVIINSYNVASYEVNILNTATATSNLEGWLVKSFVGEVETNSPIKWEELSFNYHNITERGYQICPKQNSSLHMKVQSWLRSPLIQVKDVSRVYVELNFWMRECSDLKDTVCRETFKVYCRFVDENFVEDGVLNRRDYQSVDTVAAESRFFPGRDSGPINTEIVSISLVAKDRNFASEKSKLFQRFYLAVVDEGACIALTTVRIFYKVCREVVNHLANFQETIAGPYDTSLVPVYGSCVENSSSFSTHLTANQTSPLFHCTSSGEWKIRTGNCLCNPGFEPNRLHTACVKCSLNTFKSATSNYNCTACPRNSFTTKSGATNCQCAFQNRYLSMNSHADCELCAKLPSPPYNVNATIQQHSSSALELTWSASKDAGHCKQVKYCILCQSCSRPKNVGAVGRECEFGSVSTLSVDDLLCQELSFLPQQCENLYPFIAVRNLQAKTSYRFIILALNAVTAQYYSEFYDFLNYGEKKTMNKSMFLNFDALNKQMRTLISSSGVVMTYSVQTFLPTQVRNVHVMNSNITSATIAWSSPYAINDKVVSYEVQWHPVNEVKNLSVRSSFPSVMTIADTSMVLPGLDNEMSYEVLVRAKNSAGYGNFSKPMYFRLTSENLGSSTNPAKAGNSMRIYVTLSVVIIVVVMFSIVIILHCNKKRVKTSDPLQVERSENHSHISDDISVAQRTYVDPFFLRATQSDFKCETNPDLVTTSCVIGCGEFGEVYQGVFVKKDPTGEGKDETVDVAVKQLRAQCEPYEQLDFLREANALTIFQHPNIVKLEAVVTMSRPFMIVTELMKNGCLAAFLQRHRLAGRAFPPIVLVRMLNGVAKGMEYLSGLNYIHRDLAARNVLINEELVCKVADFGLTRRAIGKDCTGDSKSTYTARSGKIAIRWTAPEAVAYNCYSEASDIWSFGVFAWEVMTYAEKPYWNLTNQQILQAVNEGYRLPAPEDCPAVLHQLMLTCWHGERQTRPTFTQVVSKLDEIGENPEQLETLASAASTGMDKMSLADPSDLTNFPLPSIPHSQSYHRYATCQVEKHSSISLNDTDSCDGKHANRDQHDRSCFNDNSSKESLEDGQNALEYCDETTAMLDLDGPAVTIVLDQSDNELAKYVSHT